MNPYLLAVDEFFPEFEFGLLRDYAYQLEYGDQVAPFDGVTYRNIGLPVPESAQERIAQVLSWILGYKVIPKHVAFRLSPKGSVPPQWAHSDAEVARFGMFVYMNDGPGGTAILEHRTSGMREHPQNEEELAIWKRDYDDPNKWVMRAFVDCAPNRAVILRANLIHAAVPKDGFGDTVENGRLILLCFFD